MAQEDQPEQLRHTVPIGEHLWVRVVPYRLDAAQAEAIAADPGGDRVVVALRPDMAMHDLTPAVFCWLCQGLYVDAAILRCPGDVNAIIVPGG